MEKHDSRGLTARLFAELARQWRSHADRRRRLRGAEALHALSDQALKDCGISRSEIHSAALYGRHHRLRLQDRSAA